jgi:hypothetical protein
VGVRAAGRAGAAAGGAAAAAPFAAPGMAAATAGAAASAAVTAAFAASARTATATASPLAAAGAWLAPFACRAGRTRGPRSLGSRRRIWSPRSGFGRRGFLNRNGRHGGPAQLG